MGRKMIRKTKEGLGDVVITLPNTEIGIPVKESTKEEIEEKCIKLEMENERLKRKIAILRFHLLPRDEIRGVLDACTMKTGKMFGSEVDDFIVEYMEYIDSTRDLLY